MTDHYNRIQNSVQKGDANVTLRADSVEEMAEMVAEYAKHADEILEGMNTIEQVMMAKSALSKPKESERRSSGGSSRRDSFKKSSPPRRQSRDRDEDAELCEDHDEPWSDLAGKKSQKTGKYYEFDYCEYGGDWKERCKRPVRD